MAFNILEFREVRLTERQAGSRSSRLASARAMGEDRTIIEPDIALKWMARVVAVELVASRQP